MDTSVVIDLDRIDPEQLPRKVAVSAITLAELAVEAFYPADAATAAALRAMAG